MHLQPSLRHPVNAALERSHPCAKTLSMSVPACRLGAHKVIQAPFRSTVRVSLRASAAEYTTLPRPTIAARSASSETRGRTPPPTELLVVKHGVTFKKKKKGALQARRSVRIFAAKPCQVVNAVTRLRLQVFFWHSRAEISPCWHAHGLNSAH